MTVAPAYPPPRALARETTVDALRELARQTLQRAAGARLVEGNAIALLRDARENYPAWLDAIAAAERTVHFESYIVHEDAAGARFAEALIAAAKRGVRVRVLYDWLGGVGKTSRRFWRRLAEGGVEVRVFNPPSFSAPLGWVSRDHRKSLTVDGRVAFVSGLCVGRMWEGDPARGIAPWRDTGVAIRGPAVADVERAFARAWATTGAPVPAEDLVRAESIAPAGDVALRIIATEPGTTGLFRLDQLVASVARRRLWLTDAYFVGTPPYVQALCAAARDGVDVRLLVPDASDIPLLRPLTRAGFRPLLEAGVRVFEWRGPMMHAKTAVADDTWSRVGSTNLNVASWVGNWELDVAVEDEDFAHALAAMYEEDLANATEVVLDRHWQVRTVRRDGAPQPHRRLGERRGNRGSVGRATAGAIRLGHTVSAAVAGTRVLERSDARAIGLAGAALLLLALVLVRWPLVLALPVALFATWGAVALLLRALELWRRAPGPRRLPTPGKID